ncbi:MAG: bifunctional biotin--[acetyl-CoA-carboxylase] ligase/biotin operon repressor BirA [Pseudomonadota bacterium]
MNLAQLLHILADGEFHSGEEIGRALGVSRAAVWKRLSGLERLGLHLEARHRTGYRIAGGLDLLDADRIRPQMAFSSKLGKLDVLLDIDSTNERALASTVHPGRAYACVAESQREGRGRHGRTWVSPFANSIYLSLAWEFNAGISALEGLSLATGVAILRALQSQGIDSPGLKWPNDIVFDGRKLGGVLIELSGEISGPCKAVIGIGLNGALPDASATEIDIPWTDLKTLAGNASIDRNALVAKLLDELIALVSDYHQQGFATWRDAWLDYDALSGQNLSVHLGDKRIIGIAAGVDGRGALLLKTGDGIQSFAGGEVSLKPIK